MTAKELYSLFETNPNLAWAKFDEPNCDLQELQNYLAEKNITEVASEYLGLRPTLDSIAIKLAESMQAEELYQKSPNEIFEYSEILLEKIQ